MTCRRSFLVIFLLLAALAMPSVPGAPIVEPPAQADLLVGRPFEQALERPLSVTWENVPLRDAVAALGQSQNVSLLVDRRFDPSRELTAEAHDLSLRMILDGVADRIGGRFVIVGHVGYLGAEPTVSKVRTLVALRAGELASLPADRARRLQLARTTAWQDLDRPDEILARIAEEAGLEIENAELVPLDMWAAGVLPAMTAAEQLTLVLAQFDLTFSWSDEGRAVRLEPVPERVAVARRYPARGRPAAELAEHWREAVPGIEAETDGNRVVVRGTIEQHEQIEIFLGIRRAPEAPLPPVGMRAYTHTAARARIRDVIARIERESELRFAIDPTVPSQALNQRVTYQVEMATLEEFLDAIFAGTGLTYEVDGETVHVSLAAPPSR